MPPCAATVWLRVGNTLLMQAVLRPATAQPTTALQAGAAGPDHHHVMGVVLYRIDPAIDGEALGRTEAAVARM